MLHMSLQFEHHKYTFLEERAGGNCPPHFEKLRLAKLILPPPLFFGIKFKKKTTFLLQYGSIYVVQVDMGIWIRVCIETIMTYFFIAAVFKIYQTNKKYIFCTFFIKMQTKCNEHPFKLL